MAILKFSAEQSSIYAFQIFVEEVSFLVCLRDEREYGIFGEVSRISISQN